METMLTTLFALQSVDSDLADIHEMKGELPAVVAALEAQVGSLSDQLKQLHDARRSLRATRDTADVDLVSSTEKIEKYKNQQLEVKSNKQYDALSKEIEVAQASLSTLAQSVEIAEGKMKTTQSDIDNIKSRLGELNIELATKQGELGEVNKEHEEEETKLFARRAKIVSKVPRLELEKYERIRKAKGGKAIVPVKRGSCGGCFNCIPPQKLLELHDNAEMYMCENCGRIVVSDGIVSASQTEG